MWHELYSILWQRYIPRSRESRNSKYNYCVYATLRRLLWLCCCHPERNNLLLQDKLYRGHHDNQQRSRCSCSVHTSQSELCRSTAGSLSELFKWMWFSIARRYNYKCSFVSAGQLQQPKRWPVTQLHDPYSPVLRCQPCSSADTGVPRQRRYCSKHRVTNGNERSISKSIRHCGIRERIRKRVRIESRMGTWRNVLLR